MSFKIALQREDTDEGLPLVMVLSGDYQPRVCISSPSGSFAMSRPGIASPSSSLASSSLTGS